MRRVFLFSLIASLFMLPGAFAQDANSVTNVAAGGMVEPQPGTANTFRVRVVASPPPNGQNGGQNGVQNGQLVTIDEFPVADDPLVPVADGGGPIVSEPLPLDTDSTGAASVAPRTLATLYGVPITEEDVAREMWMRRGRETFEWILGRDILRRELRRLNISVTDAEVAERLARHLDVLRKAYPNLKKTDDLARAASGMPLAEYRERTVWTEIALRKIMDEVLETREEDVRKFFALVRPDYVHPERVRIAQIFIPPQPGGGTDNGTNGGTNGGEDAASPGDWPEAERRIREAHDLLVRDEFDNVAANYGSGGGLSRWMTRGELLRELEEPAFSIGKGSITNPIKTSMGWHILHVLDREERSEPELDDVRDEVTARYREERFARLAGEFMARLREKTLETGGLVIVDVPGVFDESGSKAAPATGTE